MAERGAPGEEDLLQLEDSAPDLATAVHQAVQEGIPGDAIMSYVRRHPKFKAGLEAGVPEADAMDYLGIGDVYRSDLQKKAAEGFGYGREATSALTLGGSKVAEAGARSGNLLQFVDPMGLPSLATAKPLPDDANRPSYSEAYKSLEAGQSAYEAEHPGISALTNAVGTLPATATGLRLVQGGARLATASIPRVGAMLTGDVATGASGLERFARPLTSNALMGGEASVMQGGVQPGERSWSDIGEGMAAGAAIGGVQRLFGHAMTGDISPYVAENAQRAASLPTPINLAPRQLSETAPGQVSHGLAVDQLKAFQRNLSHSLGEDFDTFSTENMAKARKNIGDQLSNVVPRLGIDARGELTAATRGAPNIADDLAAIETKLHANMDPKDPGFSRVEFVLGQLRKELTQAAGRPAPGGFVAGEKYQTWTNKDGLIDQLNQGNTKRYFADVRGAVENALERGSPADAVETFRDYRAKYKNLIALEDPAAKAATNTGGLINPDHLPGALRGTFDDYGWKGTGPRSQILADLAEVSKFVPKPTATGGVIQRGSHNWGKTEAALAGSGITGAAILGIEKGPELLHSLASGSPSHLALAAGGATLAGLGFGGRLAARRIAQQPWYRNAVLGSVLAPNLYPTANPLLVAPMVAATQERSEE